MFLWYFGTPFSNRKNEVTWQMKAYYKTRNAGTRNNGTPRNSSETTEYRGTPAERLGIPTEHQRNPSGTLPNNGTIQNEEQLQRLWRKFKPHFNTFNTFNSRWKYLLLLILIIYLFIFFCSRLVYTYLESFLTNKYQQNKQANNKVWETVATFGVKYQTSSTKPVKLCPFPKTIRKSIIFWWWRGGWSRSQIIHSNARNTIGISKI